MIDFRYHLISIVSIFLALAVGIVLGAGPLQDNLGVTLGDQVTALRAEKDALRAERDEAARVSDAVDEYVERVNPGALSALLEARQVLVLSTPDAEGPVRDAVVASLGLAGATVRQGAITDLWVAPDRVAARQEALDPIIEQWGDAATLPIGADRAPAFLARLLVTNQVGATPTPADVQALADLAEAGLMTGPDAAAIASDRPALVVVVGGRLTGDADEVTARSATLTTLVSALDSASSGSVTVGGVAPVDDPATTSVQTDLVTELRELADLRDVVSTVDHAATPAGSGTAVLALVEQARGAAGHYGISPDASAVVPDAP